MLRAILPTHRGLPQRARRVIAATGAGAPKPEHRMQSPITFDDLTIGQVFTSESVTLDRDQIIAFGRQYDPQPQHLGEEEARATQIGRLIASGWHTAVVTMRLQVDVLFGRIPGGGLGRGVEQMTWTLPVYPGDRVHAVIEVLGLRVSESKPGRGWVSLRTTAVNQDGQTVLAMRADVLFPRRAG